MFERLLHSLGDCFRRIDPAGRYIHASESDFEIRAQLEEYGHIACLRRRKFHRQVLNLQSVQMLNDRTITTAMRMLSPGPGSGSPAEMHCNLNAFDPAD